MNNLIKFEPVTIGEIFPFFTSIILLIITWRSLSNAKKGNEITKNSMQLAKQALDLQNKQFIYSLKPDIIFNIPSKIINQSAYDIDNIKDFEAIFQKFFIRNSSPNICYDISVKAFVYMDNTNWDKYYEITHNNLKNTNHILSLSALVSSDILHSLDNTRNFELTIPPFYHYLHTKPFDFFPCLYIKINYKDKVGNFYEEHFTFDRVMETIEESVYVIDFEPRIISAKKVKKDLFNQEKFLNNKYGSSGFNYYYDY